jgi:hypothetical protein
MSDFDLDGVLRHFDEHGYARLGQVFEAPVLEQLRERADDLMLGRVTYPGFFFQLDASSGKYEDAPLGIGWQGPSLEYRKLEKLEKDERYLAALSHPLFERVVRGRIEGGVVLYRAILFNKAAKGGSDIPWHQDAGKLWGLSQDPFMQIWTAIDDAPLDGGCLEVLPGSHQWGLATALGGVVPADQVRAKEADAKKVPLPAKAGECLLIHNKVWHRSGRSLTGHRRLGLSVCYMSEATRCLRTKRAPRVFFRVFGS